jgi:hypothetical protein
VAFKGELIRPDDLSKPVREGLQVEVTDKKSSGPIECQGTAVSGGNILMATSRSRRWSRAL